jgi:hypothetical protein
MMGAFLTHFWRLHCTLYMYMMTFRVRPESWIDVNADMRNAGNFACL